MENFFILTGAMGSGKSATLSNLKDSGFTTVNEPARQILSEQRSFDGNGVPENDSSLFVELMLSRAVYQYRRYQVRNVPVIFDRAIPDNIAYASLLSASQQPAKDTSEQYRYNTTVFFFPAWKEIYITDDERKMTFEAAKIFGDELNGIYNNLGYKLVEVPKKSAEDRCNFIKEYIESIL